VRGQVDGCGRVCGCEAGVEARSDEYGPAARADSRSVRRREGHVVQRVERAWDIASQVRERDVRRRNGEVRVVRRVGDECEDVRECPVVPPR
jgi:hypothetical protein